MEESRKGTINEGDKKIIFSKAIKAGKRIYYLDVKKSKRDEMFISVTESKKVISGDDASNISFEKHKIFLYKEDFEKFMDGLNQAIKYIEHEDKSILYKGSKGEKDKIQDFSEEFDVLEKEEEKSNEIKIDIDF